MAVRYPFLPYGKLYIVLLIQGESRCFVQMGINQEKSGITGNIPVINRKVESKISYGKSDKTWAEYNIFTNPILSNNKETVYRAIVRNDQMVAIVRKNYTLLPNEKALEASLEAAKLTGMEPFFIKKKNNYMLSASGTKLYAMFTPKGQGVHRVDGDEVQLGVTIQNSIDGSSSFGCGLFSFRSACQNGVIIGKKNIETVFKVHTKSLDKIISNLQGVILQVMEKGNIVLESYREMAREKITLELVEKLMKSRLSKKVLPEYVTEKETLKTDLEKLTEWQLYNDVTQAIWHGEKTDISTKELQFNYLHAVMPVARI